MIEMQVWFNIRKSINHTIILINIEKNIWQNQIQTKTLKKLGI